MNKQNIKQEKHIPMRFWSMFLGAFCLGSFAYAQEAETAANVATETFDSTTVNIAFRKVLAADELGTVTHVNVAKLIEKNFSTDAMSGMQAYVPGLTDRGKFWGFDEYLVVIDGVPGRKLNNIRPDEIEEMTFLKGAQAVLLYGSHAAKGVILVTTKRGDSADAIKIQVRAMTGWAVNKAYPTYLGSAEYMILYNEARDNEGESPLYSNDDIYNHALGEAPYRYPSVNFYSDEFIKKARNRTEASLEISGGGERAQYYTNVSYYRQASDFKFGEAKNNYIDRLNVRGNVDMKFSDMLKAHVNANVALYDSRTPNSGNYWDEAQKLRPNRVAPLIPMSSLNLASPSVQTALSNARPVDGGKYILGGVKTQQESNIFADYYSSGYKTFSSRQLQFDTGMDFDFSNLLKGLSFHVNYALDYQTEFTTKYEDKYETYDPSWSVQNGFDEVLGLEVLGQYTPATEEGVDGGKSNLLMAANAHLDYNNSFGDHNVSAIIVANGDQLTETGQYHRNSAANLGAMVNYNFAHKYYLNAGTSITHTAKLHEDMRKKAGFSVEAGWNAAKESFLEGGIFDDLVLSGAYSTIHSDLDIDNYYMYAGSYKQTDYWNWDGGTGVKATASKIGSNPGLDYLTRREISASLRVSLLQKSLDLYGTYFTNTYNGGIVAADFLYPSYFTTGSGDNASTFNTKVNFEKESRYGFEFGVNYKKNLTDDLRLEFGANGSWYYAEATKRDDSKYEEDYQKRTGKDLYANWGYVCLGFFQDQADIDASPDQSSFGETIRPGDLKYKDINGDDKIDTKDQVLLSRTTWDGSDGVNEGGGGSPLNLGAHFTAKYKGFTLYVHGTGSFGAEGVKNSSYYWVKGDGKYSEVVRDRWTKETKDTAKYPRLTTKNGANNFVPSTFWTYKANRFDISKVQLTYDLSQDIIGGTILRDAQIFVNATDLLTISKERKHMEMNVGNAPQTRSYNLGIKVTF